MSATGFGWVLLATAVFGGVHSLLASQFAKHRAERWFGSAVKHWYRLFFVLNAFFQSLILFSLVWFLPDRVLYAVPMPWSIGLVLLELGGVTGIFYTVRLTGVSYFLGMDAILNPGGPSEPGILVTHGFYRHVRHPMYFFTLLLIWLSPLMSWNLLALNIGLTLYMVIGSELEERKLLAEFGEAYAVYRRKTPRIFPALFQRR